MTWPVHPAAAVWPMLPEDELRALADSITEVGLLEPVVLTPDGLLLDGRNRAAACEQAGVEPTTVVYDGDPVSFVRARNARRRHMSHGAIAMADWLTAILSPEETTVRSVAAESEAERGQIGKAKIVHDHAPDLAPPDAVENLARGKAHSERLAWEASNRDHLRQQFTQGTLADMAALVPLGEGVMVRLGEMDQRRIQIRKDMRTKVHLNELRAFDVEMTFWHGHEGRLGPGDTIGDLA